MPGPLADMAGMADMAWNERESVDTPAPKSTKSYY